MSENSEIFPVPTEKNRNQEKNLALHYWLDNNIPPCNGEAKGLGHIGINYVNYGVIPTVFLERRLEREPGFELTKPSTGQELHRTAPYKRKKKKTADTWCY